MTSRWQRCKLVLALLLLNAGLAAPLQWERQSLTFPPVIDDVVIVIVIDVDG